VQAACPESKWDQSFIARFLFENTDTCVVLSWPDIVCSGQTIVCWDQTMVWREQTMVCWQQTSEEVVFSK